MIVIEKAWGAERVICNTELYCSKYLHVVGGYQSSLHYHKKKDETFYVIDGECELEIGDQLREMKKGDYQRIRPGDRHRFSSKTGCVIIETSTQHSDDDVFRIAPSGKIAELSVSA